MVAALLMIIFAMALPNLLRSRVGANESSAVSSLRVLFNAESQYSTHYNTYSADFDTLGPPTSTTPLGPNAADLVDQVLAGRVSGTATKFSKAGYVFVYSPTGAYPTVRFYSVTADPIARGSTGQRSYWLDQTGVVRVNPSAPASANDPPLM